MNLLLLLDKRIVLQGKEIAFIKYTVVILWLAECCSDDCVLSDYRQTAPLTGSTAEQGDSVHQLYSGHPMVSRVLFR